MSAGCQQPTAGYLLPTPDPAAPEHISYGVLEEWLIRYDLQLGLCNKDKRAVLEEFTEAGN